MDIITFAVTFSADGKSQYSYRDIYTLINIDDRSFTTLLQKAKRQSVSDAGCTSV